VYGGNTPQQAFPGGYIQDHSMANLKGVWDAEAPYWVRLLVCLIGQWSNFLVHRALHQKRLHLLVVALDSCD
jgi:hypothetical protein